MKRDDVIKALEILDKMDFFQGQRAGRELWNDKPFEMQEEDISSFLRDVMFVRSIIRELTEENKAQESAMLNALKQIAKVRRETKAETVQKYGKAVYQFIFGFIADKIGEQDKDYIVVRLAQIAEELLKGDEE